jgi:poly(A) polymerase Pap1
VSTSSPIINQIDFLFATLDKAVIPEDLDLLDEANLKNLDEKSVLSLNGTHS